MLLRKQSFSQQRHERDEATFYQGTGLHIVPPDVVRLAMYVALEMSKLQAGRSHLSAIQFERAITHAQEILLQTLALRLHIDWGDRHPPRVGFPHDSRDCFLLVRWKNYVQPFASVALVAVKLQHAKARMWFNTKFREPIQWEIGDDCPVFRMMSKLKPTRGLFLSDHDDVPIRHQHRGRRGQFPAKTSAHLFPADAVQQVRLLRDVNN
jgi:hypothetical protein